MASSKIVLFNFLRMVALLLLMTIGCAQSAKVLVFPVYIGPRQGLFDAVADNLALNDHNVTFLVFEEDISPSGGATKSILPPQTHLVSRETSAPYGAAKRMALWERRALSSGWTPTLSDTPSAYLSALAGRCEAVLGDDNLIQQLRHRKIELLVTDMLGHDVCGLALALVLGRDGAPPVVVGVMPSATLPAPFSYYTASPVHPLTVLPEMAGSGSYARRLSAVWSHSRRLTFWDDAYFTVALRVACRHLQHCPGSVKQLYRRMALVLVNGDVSMEPARPYYPNTVFVGGLTGDLATLLPKETEEIVRFHRAGVILVTFEMSAMAEHDCPPFLLNSIEKGLAKLPYAVLWKTNRSRTDGTPKNIFLDPHLSTQDIMGHGRTRLVISLCTAETVFNAIFHSVPLLCLPLLDDQLELAGRTGARGISHSVPLDQLTPDTLLEAVTTVLSNQSFKQNIRLYNELLRDHPETPQDRVLYWLEYVLRRNGAPHLRNTIAIRMSFWEYFLVDIILAAIGFTVITSVALAGAYLAARRYRLSRIGAASDKAKSE